MAKIQTRRSISVKGITYQRLKNYCRDADLSVSGFIEDLIAERLDSLSVPVPQEVEPRRQARPAASEDMIRAHFTF